MYAVIQTGGKQYRVQTGDVVQIEKIEGEKGSSTNFSEVLMVAKPATDSTQIWLGKPLLSGASVSGEIVGQGRGDKIVTIKMKRRKQYRRTIGHRQEYTQILITGLANGSGESLQLSASDRTEKLAVFQTHLKPRGIGLTAKTLGSRKRTAAKLTEALKAGTAAPKVVRTAATAKAALIAKNGGKGSVKTASPKTAAAKAPAAKKAPAKS